MEPMLQINAETFITDHFLLNSEIAQILYHKYAKAMPIIDYHNHLSPQLIAENKPINNITDAWLKGDHYKWRGMRANGIHENFITGNASSEEKFNKWAETVPYTLRNPLFHWTQLELKRYFNIDEILQPSSAKQIYEQTNAILAHKTPAQLLEDMNVEIICTTDDPVDDLSHHLKIAAQNFFTKVLPTFRADNLFLIEEVNFRSYLLKLTKCTGFEIKSFQDLLRSIDQRIAFFNDKGCRLSDFGVGKPPVLVSCTLEEVTTIFSKFIAGNALSIDEVNKYKSAIFIHLGKKYHEYEWVQQYHLGAIRSNNSKLEALAGQDVGCDSIGDYQIAGFLSKLFDTLNSSDQLAKTIVYNLNPSQNEVVATMLGNFNADVPGKMQWGAGWWFLDQKDGMEKQLEALSNLGLLSRFVGMLTDSRSFLSFSRHEYFRRILCDLLGEDVKKGLIPNDIEFLGKMVQDICYTNAKNYLKL